MKISKSVAVSAMLLVGLIIGYRIGQCSVQSANDLISAGFIIADPAGYQVDRFDDGLNALIFPIGTQDSEENPFN